MKKWRMVIGILLFPACSPAVTGAGSEPPPAPAAPPTAEPAPSAPSPPIPERPIAPWSAPALGEAEIPPVYSSVWRGAENRTGCALVVPASLGAGAGAAPRRANFSGGWGIAYDQPGLRSAFGVAGAGVDAAAEGTYDEWPHERFWSDGSRVGYGPEGGTGPNMLAYLRIEGQACLYNVWSRLGREHLEHLLESLRFVEPEP